MKRAEAGFIAKKRATRHGGAAREKNVDGSIEPDHRDARAVEKFGSALLGVGAAAESKDSGLVKLDGTAEGRTQLLSFKLAKGGLTMSLEKFRDGDASGFLDALVEVNETPAELLGKASADRAFARTHETGEAENGGTG